jgi:hypothetical protein
MSALTTHTFGNQRKRKRKETNKKKLQQTIESRERQRIRSLEEDKSRTLRQGQRLDTFDTKPCSSKELKPPKLTGATPAHMQTPPEQAPTLGTNRSGRFPKPVRLVPKTGQADLVQQTTPPSGQTSKRNAQAPPWLLGYVPGMQCNFSPPFFPPPPCCCDNPPRKIPYYCLNQSTLVIKQQ